MQNLGRLNERWRGLDESFDHFDRPMLVWRPLDVAFAFQDVQAVNDGLIGFNLAAGLDFANEGGLLLLTEILLDKTEDGLLLGR